MDIQKIIAVFLLLFLLIVLSYGFFFSAMVPNSEPFSLNSAIPECKNGATKSCIKSSCNGTQSCVSGSWEDCIINDVCKPGKRQPCEGSCSSGYKICNDCGTGFGPCIEGDQSN